MSHDHQALLQSARAALARGDAPGAARIAQALLRDAPTDPGALALLAQCGAVLADPRMALAGLQPLLLQQPDSASLRNATADALNMLGARQRAVGASAQALPLLQQALALQPRHRLAWFNAAACLHQLGRDAEALQALEGHLHLRPDDDEAHLLAARLLRAAEPMRAAAHLQQLHDPRQLPAAMAEADGLDRDGADAAARTAFSALRLLSGHGRRAPGLRAVLGEQLALPAVYRDSAHLACAREAFEQGLAALERDWDGLVAHAEPSLAQLAWCNFKLAYQGQDDRVLQQRHGELLVRAAARMFPDFSSAPRPPRRKRARIGLLSSSWRNCTVGSYFGGWIDWLREAGLELRLYQLGAGDGLTQSLGSRAGHLHLHPGFMEHGSLEHGSLEQRSLRHGSLESLAAQVRADQLDLLLYPELGMDPRLLALAALRLAPCQVAAWGHPVTTGLATIDAFLGCADMEPPDGARHYSERLLTLPGLGVDYRAPSLPAPVQRRELGLPEHAVLVLVPQSLFKLHPDFDQVLAAVAAAAPDLRLVLFEGELGAWTGVLQQRLHAALAARGANAAQQLLWLPQQPRARYLAINAACDLMLDAPQWSGGNTALDALLSGLPIVAQPGTLMRGRQSSAMLARLGLEAELACADSDQLVQRTLQLAEDATARRALGARIVAARAQLLDAGPAREALLGHVHALYRESRHGR